MGNYRIIFICAKYRDQEKDCAEVVLQLRPLFNRFCFFMNAFKPSPAAVHMLFLHCRIRQQAGEAYKERVFFFFFFKLGETHYTAETAKPMCERRGQDIGRQADAVPPACQCPPGGVQFPVSILRTFFLTLWWKFGSAKNKEECFLLFPLAPTPRAGATSRAALAASCCETRETHRDDE